MEESIAGIIELNHFDKILIAGSINLDPKLAEKTAQVSAYYDTTNSIAVLKTTLVEYDERSAALRFFFAPLAGAGKVTLEIEVINRQTQKLLLKAQTSERIAGAFSSASAVIDPLKRAIVNFIEDNFVKEKKRSSISDIIHI